MNASLAPNLIAKAKVLTEALPYIQKFHQSIFVIKYGGSFMEEATMALRQQIAMDIVLLSSVGIHVVLVHGGGKAIDRNMRAAGIEPTFIRGLRYTDQATIQVVQETLNGPINQEICDLLSHHQGNPKSLPGNEILTCTQHYERDAQGEPIDLGWVADLQSVATAPILQALEERRIPVISPIAEDAAGQPYNTNADIAASKIAQALKARRLVYLCDTPGLLRDLKDENSLISTLGVSEVPALIHSGIISSGMRPKVESAVQALHGKVQRVHFISAFVTHSLLLEIFTDQGIGTEIVH